MVRRVKTAARRKTHCAQGEPGKGARRGWGWRKTQFAQGVSERERRPWGSYEMERGEERSAATGYAGSGQPDENRVARVSVRPYVAVRPEHVEAAAWLLLFSNYAADMKKQPEPCARSNRNVKGGRSVQPLRREVLGESGIPGCRSVSVSHLLADDDERLGWDTALGRAPGETLRCASTGRDSGWGAAGETRRRLSLDENGAGSVAPSPPTADRSDQLPSRTGVQQSEGISSEPLNGARREKDLNTPTIGPRCLRGT